MNNILFFIFDESIKYESVCAPLQNVFLFTTKKKFNWPLVENNSTFLMLFISQGILEHLKASRNTNQPQCIKYYVEELHFLSEWHSVEIQ